MPETLMQALDDPNTRRAVVRDTVTLIESEVASKSGIRGMTIKAGYATVKKIKPGIVPSAVEKLLPHFAPAVDPFYTKAVEQGQPRAYFTTHASTIAEALLAITDGLATRADNAVMKKVYAGLRGQAKDHTAAAMPGLADLIGRHVS